MRIIPDQLKSRNLVPFKKRAGKYNIPGMTSESQVSMDRVDSDLSPEEQGYIRHYLGYADALIKSAAEHAPPVAQESELLESAKPIDERLKAEPPPPAAPITEVINEIAPHDEDPSEQAA
jgi:hypothetical protein